MSDEPEASEPEDRFRCTYSYCYRYFQSANQVIKHLDEEHPQWRKQITIRTFGAILGN